jgi:hypothetical protein
VVVAVITPAMVHVMVEMFATLVGTVSADVPALIVIVVKTVIVAQLV